jgi:hypothetical protein
MLKSGALGVARLHVNDVLLCWRPCANLRNGTA